MDGRFNQKKQGRGPGKPQVPGMNWTIIFWIFLILLLIGPWISKQYGSKGTQISYSAFRKQVEAGNVSKVTVEDLKQATWLARKMILEWGMGDESLGEMAMGDSHETVFLGHEIAQRREYSEATAKEVDEEIKKILRQSYNQAKDILRKHREGLDRVAEELIEKEEISGKEVLELVGVEKSEAASEEKENVSSPSPLSVTG
jgi:ATP-dependent Zn protease